MVEQSENKPALTFHVVFQGTKCVKSSDAVTKKKKKTVLADMKQKKNSDYERCAVSLSNKSLHVDVMHQVFVIKIKIRDAQK